VVSLLTILVMSAAACGALDETQDKANTVDEAVSLLQAVDNDSTWSYVADGLDELDALEHGYALQTHFRETSADDSGASDTQAEQAITIQVDADDDALIEITSSGQSETYFVQGYHDTAERAPVYRVEANRYACAWQDDRAAWFQNGPEGLFAAYGIEAMGVRLLLVAERDEDGDEPIAGRDAIRYKVESRVDDARDILARLDNEALQTAVDAAGTLDFSGALYLDEDTLALLQVESTYTEPSAQRRTEFRFEITAWDDVADIPAPAANEIDTPCE